MLVQRPAQNMKVAFNTMSKMHGRLRRGASTSSKRISASSLVVTLPHNFTRGCARRSHTQAGPCFFIFATGVTSFHGHGRHGWAMHGGARADVCAPGHADWDRMLRNFDQNALHAASGGRGHWSDPDMLIVGVPGINDLEAQSIFSLWAISAAPLWAGNDLVTMSPETQRILTNPEIIAVDQDPLGQPGTLVQQEDPGLQVWARPLSGQDSPQAVLLFNRTAARAKIQIQWENLGIYGPAVVRDLWAHQDLGVLSEKYVAEVPAHGVVVLRVIPSSR